MLYLTSQQLTKHVYMKTFLYIVLSILLLTVAYFQLPMFGKHPSGQRLERIEKSKNYRNGSFHNPQGAPHTINTAKAAWHFLVEKNKNPTKIQSVKTNLLSLKNNEDVLIWFGHSSYLMQIEGIKILVDPVFNENASPIPFVIQAFNGTNIYHAEDIPEVDYLIITHDHWDHLDYKTVKKLKDKVKNFICPLGVGEHLEYWGFDSSKIIEMDWEDIIKTEEEFRVFCLPSQHFSGRGFVRNKSLWASFLIETPSSFRIFAGCDGGYGRHFTEIGNKFQNIDLAILENGQYNKNWKTIHMHPNEVIQAVADLKAKTLLPIHVAKFNLSTHSWYEPLYKIYGLSTDKDFRLLTPMIGEKVYIKNKKQTFSKWWEHNLKQDILIYCDEGVGQDCLINTVKFFKERVDPLFHNVIQVTSEYLIKGNWEERTKLLVIPGGADIPYYRALRGIGCSKITDFVTRSGGSCLGICAGAYFMGKSVEFAVGTDLEVVEVRELGFFDGKTVGPILKEYVYDSEEGSCAADILFVPLGIQFFSYYNGGCTFVDSKNSKKDYEILATFIKSKENLPAIIKRKAGAGTVILSGGHFEYDSYSPEILNVCESISKTSAQKELAIKFILDQLGVKTKN